MLNGQDENNQNNYILEDEVTVEIADTNSLKIIRNQEKAKKNRPY